MTAIREGHEVDDPVYGELYLHYSAAPIKVPQADATYEILRLLYSPREARLALRLPLVSRGRVTIDELMAGDSALDPDLHKTLDGMMAKGLLLSSGRDDQYRSLWDFFFLLTDVTFARFEGTPLQKELGRLREVLWKEGWAHDIFSSTYPFVRVLPYEEQLDRAESVLGHERATNILEEAEAIALTSSACHVAAMQADIPSLNSCDHSSGGYFCFNASAHYFVKHRGARYVDLAQAKAILAASTGAGLVLTAMNQREKVPNICMCCPVCCIHFRELRESGNAHAIAKSGFTPRFKHDACEDCGECIDACPTGALIALPRAPKDGVTRPAVGLLEEKCIGCGLCAAVCPSKAITLRRSFTLAVERTTQDAWRKFEEQRRW